jgi:hypothetical protein
MKNNRERSKETCLGKLQDDVTQCPYKALLGERYCGIHKKKYEKRETEKALEDENRLEDEGSAPKVEVTMSEYRKEQLEIVSKIDKNDQHNSKLFVVKFPDGAKMIDFDKNKEDNIFLDFSKITHASHIQSHWLCPNNIPEHGTFLMFADKTSQCRVVNGKKVIKGCKVCCKDAFRVHDKKEVEKRISEAKEDNTLNMVTGDSSELFVAEILMATGKYKNVEKIGQSGGKGDVLVTYFDNSVRYIQVKTLTKSKDKKNNYSLKMQTKYEKNMLIAGVDNDRKVFILDFYETLGKSRSYTFNGKSPYKKTMYTDQDSFIDKCHQLIPFSCQVNSHNDKCTKEKESLERLAAFCKANSFEYKKNDTNSNTIDGFINGYSFQAKFKSQNGKDENIFTVNFTKSAGYLKGKQIFQCYCDGDFDFFIVELGGTRDGKKNYKNTFCIIPRQILADNGRYQTETSKGNCKLTICPPDYIYNHWSKQFWNRIDLIPKPKT